MKRLRSRLLALLALLLSAATVVLWIESKSCHDVARAPLSRDTSCMAISDKGRLYLISIQDALDSGWGWSRSPVDETYPFDGSEHPDLGGFQWISTFHARGLSVPFWFIESVFMLLAVYFGCSFLPNPKRRVCASCGKDFQTTLHRCPVCGHVPAKAGASAP